MNIDFLAHGINLQRLNRSLEGTLDGCIGLQFVSIGRHFLQAQMAVTERTRQPHGRLHGGASAVMIETLGSVASHLLVAAAGKSAVGMAINASHVRSMTSGLVTGTVTALHVGRSTHVWDVRLHNPAYQLVCVGRLTTTIIAAAAVGRGKADR